MFGFKVRNIFMKLIVFVVFSVGSIFNASTYLKANDETNTEAPAVVVEPELTMEDVMADPTLVDPSLNPNSGFSYNLNDNSWSYFDRILLAIANRALVNGVEFNDGIVNNSGELDRAKLMFLLDVNNAIIQNYGEISHMPEETFLRNNSSRPKLLLKTFYKLISLPLSSDLKRDLDNFRKVFLMRKNFLYYGDNNSDFTSLNPLQKLQFLETNVNERSLGDGTASITNNLLIYKLYKALIFIDHVILSNLEKTKNSPNFSGEVYSDYLRLFAKAENLFAGPLSRAAIGETYQSNFRNGILWSKSFFFNSLNNSTISLVLNSPTDRITYEARALNAFQYLISATGSFQNLIELWPNFIHSEILSAVKISKISTELSTSTGSKKTYSDLLNILKLAADSNLSPSDVNFYFGENFITEWMKKAEQFISPNGYIGFSHPESSQISYQLMILGYKFSQNTHKEDFFHKLISRMLIRSEATIKPTNLFNSVTQFLYSQTILNYSSTGIISYDLFALNLEYFSKTVQRLSTKSLTEWLAESSTPMTEQSLLSFQRLIFTFNYLQEVFKANVPAGLTDAEVASFNQSRSIFENISQNNYFADVQAFYSNLVSRLNAANTLKNSYQNLYVLIESLNINPELFMQQIGQNATIGQAQANLVEVGPINYNQYLNKGLKAIYSIGPLVFVEPSALFNPNHQLMNPDHNVIAISKRVLGADSSVKFLLSDQPLRQLGTVVLNAPVPTESIATDSDQQESASAVPGACEGSINTQ